MVQFIHNAYLCSPCVCGLKRFLWCGFLIVETSYCFDGKGTILYWLVHMMEWVPLVDYKDWLKQQSPIWMIVDCSNSIFWKSLLPGWLSIDTSWFSRFYYKLQWRLYQDIILNVNRGVLWLNANIIVNHPQKIMFERK